ncbi:MAG: cbb3-type cytochrome c oxidase subunit 3 [Myxococcales bacterium]|nr:cbb3-type cytochrome c oxidase subunit 3 [Myxococcales bacterium]
MNTVLREAGGSATNGWLSGIATVLFMTIFVGYALWLWSKRSKDYVDEASQIPFETQE